MRIRAALVAGTCVVLIAADPPAPSGDLSLDRFRPFFLIGAAGATALEVLKRYEYRGDRPHQ